MTTLKMMKTTIMMLPLVLLAGGCHKKTDGGPRIEQVSDAFAAAGLAPQAFQPTDASRFSASRCYAGSINGVDAVLCEYSSPDALAVGKQAGEQWAATAPTAAVLGNGRTLLALADRAHSDPNGKTIHKITRTFTKTR
jgi:hypothetical protein